mmetsp:Transcript_10877/g.24707  ORF Transcript_10877/g.24707 Transcript_10877/m.24707 type:complete len:280 (-) Transcript_10877:242-1081(-)
MESQRHCPHRGVEAHALLNHRLPDLVSEPDSAQELGSHGHKTILGPRSEPVNRRAVHQGRELSKAVAEVVADRRHAQDDVHVLTAGGDEKLVYFCGGRGTASVFSLGHHAVHDSSKLVAREEVRDFPSVEDVVHVFELGLEHHLGIREEEDTALALHPSLLEQNLKILSPLCGSVQLPDFDLYESVVAHSSGQPGRALTPAASNTDQQRVPKGLADNARDGADVLDDVVEQHQVHRPVCHRVVVVEVVVHRLVHQLHVRQLRVLPLLGLQVLHHEVTVQ